MPTEAADIHTTIFKNGTGTFLARVIGANGTPVTPEAIASATYSVYLLDDQEPDARQAVAGHSGVTLSVADVLYASVQTDAIWTRDAIGYNFRHTLDVSTHAAFPNAGRRYLVEYQFLPVTGQSVLARFRVNVI
jgi:hypothetical protein